MSLMETIHDHSGLPGSILTVLVALLLLLAGIIWVAFCIALYRAAQRVAEIKRQRRRQHIIAAALNRAVNQQSIPSVQAGISLSFPTSSPNDLSPDDLPSYEEAIQVPPPPEWHKAMNNRPMTGHDSLRIFTNTGLLRYLFFVVFQV
uniref:Uncharacterized protein n=1 Tax=Panagrolaimus sp. ES5 TaxID=591445 RepID=A0AC34GQT7_9BILA